MVVVFTKFDALDVRAFDELQDPEGTDKLSWEEARILAPNRAVVNFEPQLKILYQMKFPPKGHVLLRGEIYALSGFALTLSVDMYKDDAHCRELMECTARIIDDNFQLLRVSSQNNTQATMDAQAIQLIELCCKISVSGDTGWDKLQKQVLFVILSSSSTNNGDTEYAE